ncbi:MAG TPA: IPT/TIG domain-containing protein [Trebonia sp.]|nr:IPT/TIG domain-containing protein [Trebonia sp.]
MARAAWKNVRLAKQALFVPLLAAGVLLGSQAAAVPAVAAASTAVSSSALGPVPLPASAAPRPPSGATSLGDMPATQQVHFDITLKVRDQAVLTEYLSGLANRNSPYFHHFLSKGQFGPLFGPTLSQVAQVEAALRAAGLTPGQVTADRLTIPVTASASAVEHAFGISLQRYRLHGGRVAYANSAAPKIAASVAPIVEGVLGLNNLAEAQSASLVKTQASPAGSASPARAVGPDAAGAASATGPQPCAAASSAWANTTNVFADYYGMSQLYGLDDFGQGERIGVMEFEPDLASDISAYEGCYGISTPVNYITVDGGSGTGAGSGEAALDIELLASLAPDSTIDVYQAPNTISVGMHDVLAQFVTDDTDSVLSSSWGLCESEWDSADLNADAELAEEADAQGQTILSASGDDGSTACSSSSAPDATVDVLAPAVSPYVVSVGGTGLNSSGKEVVWNESGTDLGAGGGGISQYWCMPDYQYQPSIPGIFGPYETTNSACTDSVDPQGYAREVPDVSANADPYSGYVIYYDGEWQGGWGGTSAATPLWGAIAALTDASPFCSAYGSGPAGVLPQALYAAVASNQSKIYSGSYSQIMRDVTSGNNDYTPSGYTGGSYPAAKGYDLASGLGAPIVGGVDSTGAASTYFPGFTAMMCRQMATTLTTDQVTSVSPATGPAEQTAKVTIDGAGFLPIAGADRVGVYSGSTLLATLTPSCTTVACTVTLPAEAPGTVDLRVSVEDGAYTSAVAADHYTYAPGVPSISSLSPAKGTASGGTKVTIHGSNFVGVKSVTFSGKAGTSLTVTSSSTLTVDTPKGTEGETAKVVVTAAGGTSSTASYLYVDTPHISSLAPAKGSANGGTKVTIHGSNLVGVKSVTFGGKAGTKIAVTSTTSLTVVVPKGTEGKKVNVVVTAAGGTSNAATYLYADTPHISSLSPAKGTHNGGSKITIRGGNFVGVKSVTFGGKACTKITVTSLSALTVVVPKGTEGTKVKVVITAAGGTSNSVLYLYT